MAFSNEKKEKEKEKMMEDHKPNYERPIYQRPKKARLNPDLITSGEG